LVFGLSVALFSKMK